MTYRDLLKKRAPRKPLTEEAKIKHLDWDLSYAQAREESHMVLGDEGACDLSKGMALVVLSLLDERRDG